MNHMVETLGFHVPMSFYPNRPLWNPGKAHGLPRANTWLTPGVHGCRVASRQFHLRV
jgi:hypothetical protein